ncbi:MAG: hypothetical protein HRU75_02755 [Planctomycetia bacterium]|nr:MAG: hypothetical protein HRU75_02755 [Planctomycetia bacterium]
MRKVLIACTAGAALLAGVAHAVPTLSNTVYRIEASNALGSGFLEFTIADGSYPDADSFELFMMTPMDIVDSFDGVTVVAQLTQATLTVFDLPDFKQMSMSYAIGAFDGETTFRIVSGLFSFGAVNGPEGFASAALGVTEQDNPENGANHTPNGPLGKSHHTYYNGQAPAGTNFSRLVGGFGTIPGPGGNSADMNEGTGPTLIPGNVSSLSQELLFKISGGDIANGTVTFGVTPEPTSAAALLGLALLVVARRR